jgi:hypothetical protein
VHRRSHPQHDLHRTRPALQDRLRELREAGYNHFAISIRHGHPGMLEDWADVFAGV